ncbi:rhomboid family intramembrane serine protease [Bacterioplanoides pacificum]|uniref:Rhomboid family intramembrane serine protease n=1 Tax=Bacterioplanoides pacificum TaxID=1171596 RepID=A0ABV7VQP7_9GAMM
MSTIKAALSVILLQSLVLVLVFIANAISGAALNDYGIIPRYVDGWFHVLTAPFIHSDLSHLLNNLLGLSLLSLISIWRSVSQYVLASVFIIVITGGLVWLFGRPASHIGASGWIFGLWAWQISLALFERSFASLAICLLVIVLHGGMVAGLMPTDSSVSWEAHVGGAISGLLYAYLASRWRSEQQNN